jgi:hypothetical protein
MNYLALLLFVLSTMSAAPSMGQDKLTRQTFNYPNRTISWKPWHESPQGDYRFCTGDRYLGHLVWEHYLGFEEHHSSAKAIKLWMIRLANEEAREDVVICPGLRYAILQVTNATLTADKGVWRWTAQEVRLEAVHKGWKSGLKTLEPF